jgi:tripartite-type tricarboxylate transporter receptor subunit TctC
MSYGSAGNGTTPHVAGELLNQSAGIMATRVPYRGAAPVIQDVMAGQIDFGLAPDTVFPKVKAGKLKVLAVASRQRTVSAPDVPTFAERGINGLYADTYFGVYAPAPMPANSVERLNRELNKILAQPAIQARFAELGAEVLPLKPAEYKALVQGETRLFTEIVKSRGITAE